MKTILVMGLLALSTSAFSSVAKSYDAKNSCTLFRVLKDGETSLKDGETIFYKKAVYGISVKNLEIDFDNREAKVDAELSIVLGFNQSLVEGKVAIQEGNKQFTNVINQVSRSLSFFEKMCISSDKKIVYVKALIAE